MNPNHQTYLALGDSYTIGEGVAEADNFPHQAVQLLKDAGYAFDDPQIIAKTGWTTDELVDGIRAASPQGQYSIVSLLIGVNNQYRGRSPEEYAKEFEGLLKQAIAYAGADANRVFVLSIPDWGVTPYAEGRDRAQIAREIDAFNAVNKAIAAQYQVHYIDITPGTREAASDHSLLTGDKLHPSGKDYGRWAAKLAEEVRKVKGSQEK
ncbi:SGNH/GDSL hydrolase family protein [Paraflavitalea sp. CAU 1676]|uniref:SGNH/GDSL hydrolase family protein n=1 Tax=Paraflavitalea sp. CAU 1676 TaxID=3032598 RepID=UPI0023DC7005|nr:SGNH/GDSL hydrolase family protein [Paraflavitalea sp. CAU 1676]MDF2189340.1 SGNH/GDSL hydrolase family protein [Paraflavitalea sp. CAU 1676]